MRTPALVLFVALVCRGLAAESSEDWQTYYERSGFTRTPPYRDTIEYCQRLAAHSPWIHYQSFGVTPQGRDLPLVIVSRESAFTPEAARKTGKALLLIQSGIHAGEIDGKDATLMMLRDIAITKKEEHLLDHAILLFVPIFNVDGHERISRYNRINQNGPEEMGWRVTAQDLNLNRDYLKADAPEMRAMLKLFTQWLPDLYIDCHVTDGMDFQYDVTYATELSGNIDSRVGDWMKNSLLPAVLPRVQRDGHKIFYYVFAREDNDITKGVNEAATTPRFSTGYAALQNRPSLLIETHMLKPYHQRVSATYDLVKEMIAVVNRDAPHLRELVTQADRDSAALGVTNGSFPIRFGLETNFTMARFLGVESHPATGEISGSVYPVYSTKPAEVQIPVYDRVTVEKSVTMPYAYLIPPEWDKVIDVLKAHGVRLERLTAPAKLEIESYTFDNVKFASHPFEGRHGVTFSAYPIREHRTFRAGTVLVPTAQRTARVIANALEPEAPDSLVGWGFLSGIFEQKEYTEVYVMERVGKQLLAENPKLRQEFETRLKSDEAFARNPQARVNWLYLHSPWNDEWMNKYPIARLLHPAELKTETIQ